jgi:hypothetical protein
MRKGAPPGRNQQKLLSGQAVRLSAGVAFLLPGRWVTDCLKRFS